MHELTRALLGVTRGNSGPRGVKLRHGALYPLQNALERVSFLTSQNQRRGGGTRKVYTLTSKGQQYIEAYNNILKKQLEGQDIE